MRPVFDPDEMYLFLEPWDFGGILYSAFHPRTFYTGVEADEEFANVDFQKRADSILSRVLRKRKCVLQIVPGSMPRMRELVFDQAHYEFCLVASEMLLKEQDYELGLLLKIPLDTIPQLFEYVFEEDLAFFKERLRVGI